MKNQKLTSEERKAKKIEANKAYREANKIKLTETNKAKYEANKVKIAERAKIYYEANKAKIIEKKQLYIQLNKETIAAKKKAYYEANKEKLNKLTRDWVKNKLATDPLYKLKANIRTLVGNSIRRNGYKKLSKTHLILGCTFEQFKEHLESQFEPWMNWNNRGLYNGTENYGWDIDHIIPVSSGLTEQEVVQLNHYTNLKPLCSYINRDVKINKV